MRVGLEGDGKGRHTLHTTMANVRYLQRPLLRLCLGFKRPLSSSATSEVDLNFRLLQDDLKGKYSCIKMH